jgi:hypothetical protein
MQHAEKQMDSVARDLDLGIVARDTVGVDLLEPIVEMVANLPLGIAIPKGSLHRSGLLQPLFRAPHRSVLHQRGALVFHGDSPRRPALLL